MKAILEKIPADQSHSLALFEFKSRRFNCPFHYHPEIELTLIAASSGHRYVGDHIGRFRPGDLVLIGPNVPHMYINNEATARAHSVVLQFLPSCLGPSFFELGELKKIGHLLKRSRVGLSFHGRTREKVVPLLLQLQTLTGFARLLSILQILQLLARSTDVRTLASPAYVPSLALYQGERINRVCEMISRSFKEGVTQGDAARAARMSPPSFSRFFRRATNRTFRSFLNEVRVGHAAHLLLETDLTVAEVCFESGFGNLSNFNRQFLRLRKIPPQTYRRKLSPAGGR